MLGRRFDWALLSPVTGMADAAVVAALRRGVGLQLVAQGALALTAALDLQISAGLNKQFRADEALAAARRSADASRRFHLAVLPMALIFQATAHAIRGEREAMEARIADAPLPTRTCWAAPGGTAGRRSPCWPGISARPTPRWRPAPS